MTRPHATPTEDPRLARLLRALPSPIARFYRWLIAPGHGWARWPLALLFLVGGCLWFLPVLGLWMLPLGLLLIGHDVPPVSRLTLRLLGAAQSWWDRRRGRKGSA